MLIFQGVVAKKNPHMKRNKLVLETSRENVFFFFVDECFKVKHAFIFQQKHFTRNSK